MCGTRGPHVRRYPAAPKQTPHRPSHLPATTSQPHLPQNGGSASSTASADARVSAACLGDCQAPQLPWGLKLPTPGPAALLVSPPQPAPPHPSCWPHPLSSFCRSPLQADKGSNALSVADSTAKADGPGAKAVSNVDSTSKATGASRMLKYALFS